MVAVHHVQGYESFCEVIENLELDKKVMYVYFSGSKDPTGKSWCDDCVRAWPILEKEVLKLGHRDCHIVYVEVGDRATWKDPNCSFRKDKRTNLLVIPTLLRWKGPQKLEGEKCENPDLVSLVFAEDDD